jgi:biopolymer transport protein ExbD
VELPSSQFELERYRNTLVVTIASGEAQPRLYFGRDAVSFEELEDRLKKLQEEGAQADSIVLLRADQDTPVGAQRKVEEMALALDFDVALLGGEEQTEPSVEVPPEAQPEPKPE